MPSDPAAVPRDVTNGPPGDFARYCGETDPDVLAILDAETEGSCRECGHGLATGVPKQEPERARAQKPRSDTVVPIADNNDGDAAEPPSRLSGKRAPRAAGEVVLSGGAIAKFDSAATQRDEEGRVICRACGVYISSSMGCGCDPGELDDDGHPLDPRYSEMVVEVCAR